MKRLREIEERRMEIRTQLDQDDQQLDLTAIQSELEKLEQERKEIEARQSLAASITTSKVPPTLEVRKENTNQMNHEMIMDSAEYRSGYIKRLQGKPLTEEEQRALTTAGNSAGPAVPTRTLNKIVDRLRQTSILFPRVTVSYVPGNLSIVVANAKNAAAWKAEGTNGVVGNDTVTNITLNGFELIKLVELSAAAEAMTIDAFEDYISAELGRQMSIAVENAILTGTGTGQPLGILPGVTWNAGNSATWPAGGLNYDALVDGLALLPTLYHNNAAFVMNRQTLFGGVRKIKDTAQQPVFAYNAQDAARNSILGYPVIVNDYMPDNTILIGDLSYYYFNFAKTPTIEASREAAFSSGKVVYRGLAVADGKPALTEAFVRLTRGV